MIDFLLTDHDLADGRAGDYESSVVESVRIAIMAWRGESPFQPDRWTDWASLLGGRDTDTIRAAVILAASSVPGVTGFDVTDIRIDGDRRCTITCIINGQSEIINV